MGMKSKNSHPRNKPMLHLEREQYKSPIGVICFADKCFLCSKLYSQDSGSSETENRWHSRITLISFASVSSLQLRSRVHSCTKRTYLQLRTAEC